jgi:predicted metalloprotease with PDZ domain
MGWRRSLMNLKSVLELGMDLRAEMFSYPRLGVVNCTVNEEQSKETGVPIGQGNYLMEVFPNSPAHAAGLQKGDVVVSFDGVPTPNYAEFVRVISAYYAKATDVKVQYVRNGEQKETAAKLSLDEAFTGRVELEGTSFEDVRKKRETFAKQRSASGSLWTNEEGNPHE